MFIIPAVCCRNPSLHFLSAVITCWGHREVVHRGGAKHRVYLAPHRVAGISIWTASHVSPLFLYFQWGNKKYPRSPEAGTYPWTFLAPLLSNPALLGGGCWPKSCHFLVKWSKKTRIHSLRGREWPWLILEKHYKVKGILLLIHLHIEEMSSIFQRTQSMTHAAL